MPSAEPPGHARASERLVHEHDLRRAARVARGEETPPSAHQSHAHDVEVVGRRRVHDRDLHADRRPRQIRNAHRRNVVRAERDAGRHRRAGHSGERAHAVDSGEVRGVALRTGDESAEVERHVKQVLGREAEVLRLHALEASHEERRADHEQSAERDLDRHERVLESHSRRRAGTARPQLRSQVASVADLRDWRERGENAGDSGGNDRYREHPRVDELRGRSEIRQQGRADDAGEPTREENAGRRAARGQENALGHELSREVRRGPRRSRRAPRSRAGDGPTRSDNSVPTFAVAMSKTISDTAASQSAIRD